jgi:hypothetical protein
MRKSSILAHSLRSGELEAREAAPSSVQSLPPNRRSASLRAPLDLWSSLWLDSVGFTPSTPGRHKCGRAKKPAIQPYICNLQRDGMLLLLVRQAFPELAASRERSES